MLYDSLFGKPSHDALVDEKITSIVNFLPHVKDNVGALKEWMFYKKGHIFLLSCEPLTFLNRIIGMGFLYFYRPMTIVHLFITLCH